MPKTTSAREVIVRISSTTVVYCLLVSDAPGLTAGAFRVCFVETETNPAGVPAMRRDSTRSGRSGQLLAVVGRRSCSERRTNRSQRNRDVGATNPVITTYGTSHKVRAVERRRPRRGIKALTRRFRCLVSDDGSWPRVRRYDTGNVLQAGVRFGPGLRTKVGNRA